MLLIFGFPTGDLATIDTRDIESVDVLKTTRCDHGSSNVIMITKKGRRDSKMGNAHTYGGIQKVTERPDLLDQEGFKNMQLHTGEARYHAW
jgi:hypothetical protein